LGFVLGGMGLVLVALLLSVIGAAVRESVLDPGQKPAQKNRWLARLAVVLGGVLLTLSVWGGKHWWDAEAADYRNNRVYKPMTAQGRVRSEGGKRVLMLEINDPKFARSSPLMPDHGKLMHLFLIREPGLEAFAHLHPIKRNRKTFESVLPALPAGSYRVYADITYETGFSDTLTTLVEIPETSSADLAATGYDPDDSWRMAGPFGEKLGADEYVLSQQYMMKRISPHQYVVNQPVHLQFTVRDTNGVPVLLEPYLGMPGHLALRRDDGSVFTHLHPGGSASMAAMQLSVLRAEGRIVLDAAFGKDEPICKLPELSARDRQWLQGGASNDGATVSFPYAFPKPGRYRLWVQVRIKGEVLTGVYDVDIKSIDKGPSRRTFALLD